MLTKFPRVTLGLWPTPLEHLKRYGELLGHSTLFMKRDDLSGLAFGGNKVRNLEFQLGEALANGANVVLAAGGLQSNQCRLAAAAAVKLGLRCIVVHNASPPEQLEGNMLLHHLMGVQAVFLGPVGEEERGRRVLELTAELRSQGSRPYIVEQTTVGALGYVQAALELYEQSQQSSANIRHVCIVGAMGGTAAGFLFGTAALGMPFHVHVVSVEYPAAQLMSIVKELWAELALLTGITPDYSLGDVSTFHEEFLGPGYAKSAPEAVRAIYRLAETEAIFIENVYNSKTLWGMSELIRRGVIPGDEAVCIINTGGQPALFAQGDELTPGEYGSRS